VLPGDYANEIISIQLPIVESKAGVIEINDSTIRFGKRYGAFEIAGEIENANLAGAEARAGFCVIDCLIFLREDWLGTGRFENFPAPASPALCPARPSQPGEKNRKSLHLQH
jgi:hypothetical protein